MNEKYTDEGELWCQWGQATTAIMEYISTNEKVDSKSGWKFREGFVNKGIGKNSGYCVIVFSTAYDETERKRLFLSVQANINATGSISVATIKRCEVDEKLEKLL